MSTFMCVAKNVNFWPNTMLDSRQKFFTTAVYTEEVEIAISCTNNQTMAQPLH